MGRKTWDSLPVKPLSRRENIVVSNTMKKHMIFSRCAVERSLKDAIEHSKKGGYKQTWIIGGSSLYEEALAENYVNNIFATEIEGNYICDVFFPEIPDNFKITESSKWYTHKFTDYRYVQYKNQNTVNI